MSKTILSLDGITAHNGALTFFESLNFEIKEGEQWGVISADSVKKEAFLKVLAGQLVVTMGTIYRKSETPLAFLESSYQFKNLSGMNDFFYQQRFNASFSDDSPTVLQYLTRIYEEHADQTRWTLDKAISLFDLKLLKEKELIKLSNGETKRLRLATLLVRNPSLILLHDPLVGLDLATRKGFNKTLQAMVDAGITMVMSLEINEIPEVLTHVLVIDENTTTSYRRDQFHHITMSNLQEESFDVDMLQQLLERTKMPAFDIMVSMKDVNIQYDQYRLLKGVDLEVKQGERWALSGHNGAGKSTLLSLINGDNPQAYAVDLTLFDRRKGSGENIWEIKQYIGYVSPEQLHYFRWDTNCREVIKSGLRDGPIHSTAAPFSPDELTEHWMHLLGIEALADERFKLVTLAEQRMVLLARALIKNPPLLILDEPCQGLNTAQWKRIVHVIDEICKYSNTTMIYVTHYLEHLPNCMDHFIELKEGRVVSMKQETIADKKS